MTTSTPPAWNWLHECEAPELSIHSHKVPDSDALGERNDSDQCPDCRCAPNMPHAPDCAGVHSVRERPNKLRVGAPNEHPHGTTLPADSFSVESCPECGTVTDIDYKCPDLTLDTLDHTLGQSSDNGTFSVPFKTQEFMFEELCEERLAELPQLIDDHHDLIIEMARDRFRKGFAMYGSEMHSWTPERRLDETLCELADAVVYPTSGPLE